MLTESGQSVSYGQLDAASNRAAHLFRQVGLKRGDVIALFMENNAEYLEIGWGAQRSGLYFIPLPSRLTIGEVAYILNDAGARVLVASQRVADVARALAGERSNLVPCIEHFFSVGGELHGYQSWNAACANLPATPIADESSGAAFFYSSGTTGRPKGVKRALGDGPADAAPPLATMISALYGFDKNTVFLSPAPLYHAAPLGYCMAVQSLGGTVVVMEHFSAQDALACIEKYNVTHAQFVPTMFVRMLKLPESVRLSYDLSSLRAAIHAAAPCPIPIKHEMIKWWGPIIYEYYAGTEANGICMIDSAHWLRKPGSVGKAILGTPHIVDDNGNELPPGGVGTIYFEGGTVIEYHNDPAKTADARHPRRPTWTTIGDIGYLDEDGYLFLTDRKAFMIISGGVNIYPQEIESVLVTHPEVADVAVVGVPNEDFGEEVKAIVQPATWSNAGPQLATDLMSFCRAQLSPIKCPRSVDFERELPRDANGKLYKRPLRDRYWRR